jgi:hypothetical protein
MENHVLRFDGQRGWPTDGETYATSIRKHPAIKKASHNLSDGQGTDVGGIVALRENCSEVVGSPI